MKSNLMKRVELSRWIKKIIVIALFGLSFMGLVSVAQAKKTDAPDHGTLIIQVINESGFDLHYAREYFDGSVQDKVSGFPVKNGETGTLAFSRDEYYETYYADFVLEASTPDNDWLRSAVYFGVDNYGPMDIWSHVNGGLGLLDAEISDPKWDGISDKEITITVTNTNSLEFYVNCIRFCSCITH